MTEFDRDSIVADVLAAVPQAAPLFRAIGMHCLGCAMSSGETLEEAVARELSEETGYRLRDDIAPAVRPLPQPGFSSTGLTEENVQVVFAQVEAAGKARPDSAELIEPFTVARADLRAFLDANQLPIGTRCQLILELLAI